MAARVRLPRPPRAPRNLLEELAQLQNTAPEELDPESAGLEDGLRLEQKYEGDDNETADVAPSALRRRLAILLDDPAYAGKATSRKQLGLGTLSELERAGMREGIKRRCE